MTKSYKRERMRVPFRVYLRRAARAVFLLALLALIPFVLLFQMQDTLTPSFTGVVEGESETVGAVETARILSIEVQPGQRVSPGDVLVRLDPSDRALDVALQEARLADYEQDLLRYEQGQARYRQTLEESARRCQQAVQEAAVDLEAERMNRSRDEAELAGLRAEIGRLQPLVDKRLVSEVELSALRPKAQALELALAQYKPLIEAQQRRHDQALADLRAVQALQAEAAKDATAARSRESLQGVAQRYRQAAGREPFVLKASRAGIVSRVQRQAGDVVVAGEPIVRVASASSMYITGLLTQRQLAGVAVGDTLKVRRQVAGAQPALTAQVEAIDPEVMDLLDPFNPAPRFPVRGRRVRLRVLEANGALVPGESVALQAARQETWLESVRRTCSFFSGNRSPSL